MRVFFDAIADGFELCFELCHIGRVLEALEAFVDLLREGFVGGHGLLEELCPEVEGEGDGDAGVVGDGFAKESEVGGFSAVVDNIFGEEAIGRSVEFIGAADGGEIDGLGFFAFEHRGACCGVEVVGGIDDIDLAIVDLANPQDDLFSDEALEALMFRFVEDVTKGDLEGFCEDHNVRIRGGGLGADDAREMGNLGGDAIGKEDIGGFEASILVGFVDLCAREGLEATERPACCVALVAS